jgi:hypothetical protein
LRKEPLVTTGIEFVCRFFQNLFGSGIVTGGLAWLLVSCSPDAKSAIIGKWTESNGAVTEFRADGTCTIGNSGSPMKGKFNASGHHIWIKLDGELGLAVGTIDLKIKFVRGDAIDLTYPDNRVHHLQKTK